jgi:hypothetical protein
VRERGPRDQRCDGGAPGTRLQWASEARDRSTKIVLTRAPSRLISAIVTWLADREGEDADHKNTPYPSCYCLNLKNDFIFGAFLLTPAAP